MGIQGFCTWVFNDFVNGYSRIWEMGIQGFGIMGMTTLHIHWNILTD